MTMYQDIKRMFRRLSVAELAVAELVDAQRSLLEALTGLDYANSMVAYNQARVKRLVAYLKTTGGKE